MGLNVEKKAGGFPSLFKCLSIFLLKFSSYYHWISSKDIKNK